jgi:hypothetical protein
VPLLVLVNTWCNAQHAFHVDHSALLDELQLLQLNVLLLQQTGQPLIFLVQISDFPIMLAILEFTTIL